MTPPPSASNDGQAARRAAIVTAAGSSRRMGEDEKKEYRLLAGVPVLARAVLPFIESARFARILITVPPGQVSRVSSLLSGHVPLEGILFEEGGPTRQVSVFRGLAALAADPPSVVLIHDGARPWISPELIERVLRETERFGACVPVVEANEAVKQTGDSRIIERHFSRHAMRLAQTPQGFLFDRILAAHRQAADAGVQCSDDAEIYGLFAGQVSSVAGDIANRKITYPFDLEEGSGIS